MGGDATLGSLGYGGDELSVVHLRDYFPPHYLDMLRNARSYFELEDFIFVHAGVKPGISMGEQTPYDLMWTTEPFLSIGGQLGKRVVHGHTITKSRRPEIFKDRIAVDTGAYATNTLTAVHLYPDGKLDFLSSSFYGVRSVEPYFPAD